MTDPQRQAGVGAEPQSAKLSRREIVGGLCVLTGGVIVIWTAVVLGGLPAAGMIVGLMLLGFGALYGSTPARDVSETRRDDR